MGGCSGVPVDKTDADQLLGDNYGSSDTSGDTQGVDGDGGIQSSPDGFGNDGGNQDQTQVTFEVDPVEGPADLTVKVYARTLDRAGLPDGIYLWSFDNEQVESNSKEAYQGVQYTFRSPGIHLVRLSLTLAGSAFTASCVSGSTGRVEAAVTVWPAITGKVTDDQNHPLPDVLLVTDPLELATTTDANGNYRISVPYDWSGELVPSRDSYRFVPGSRKFKGVTANLMRQDFAAASVVNRPPVANPQSVQTNEEKPLTIELSGSDPDGDTLTYTVHSLPSHGWVLDDAAAHVINASELPYDVKGNGNVSYFPPVEYAGTQSLTFQVSDGNSDSEPALVTIVVNPTNDLPVFESECPIVMTVAKDSSASAPANRWLLVVRDTDAEPDGLTWTITPQPNHGTATLELVVGGDLYERLLTYEPDPGYVGTDVFVVQVSDGSGGTAYCNALIHIEAGSGGTSHVISGAVRNRDAAPCAGVTMKFTGSGSAAGQNFTTTTAGAGAYSQTLPSGWSGTIAAIDNHRVEPELVVNTLHADMTGTNFVSYRNFYVRPNGTDSGEGTISAPYRTLGYAQGRVYPGDTVYLRAGTYSLSANLQFSSSYCRNGTADEPVTLSGYPGETATIQGGGAQRLLQIRSGFKYWRFVDFTITGGTYNCIEIDGASDLEFENIDASGTLIPFVLWDASNIYFKSCEIHDFTGTGATAFGCADVTFEECVSHDTEQSNLHDGFEIGNSCTRTTFLRCTAYNCSDAGFDLASDTYIEDCVARDCSVGFKLWDSRKTNPSGKHQMVRGIVKNCRDYGVLLAVRSSDSHGGGGGDNHADILNCTILDCKLNIWVGTSSDQGYRSTLTVKNTISSHAADQGDGGTIRAMMVCTTNNCALLEERNNCWHRADGTAVIRYRDVDYSDAQINAGHWTTMSGFGQNSFSANPLYVNMNGGDYHLTSGSPCVNVGVNIGLSYQGSAPDLGAFESPY